MSNKNKGIIFILISSFSFAIMSMFVQLSGDISPMQKSFFRNIVSLIVAIIVIIRLKDGFKFKKENLGILFLRAAFGTIGMLFNYYAISHLILADATMLNKLAPFFVIIFSFFILKEKVRLWQILCIVVAFIGSIFIINPSILIYGKATSIFNVDSIIGLLGAVFAGLAYTMIRLLSLRGEKGSFIVFFFSLFSTLATLPFVVFSYDSMSVIQFIYLILAGIFACFGQFAITSAYSYAKAKDISIFDYSQIIFSAILGYIVFGQMPDRYSFIGYIIIVLTAIFMFMMNKKRA